MRLAVFKSKIKIISVLLCLIFTLSSFGITASAENLQDKKEEIQDRLNSLQGQLDGLNSEKKDSEEYLSTLRSKISLLQDKIDALESQKASLQEEIDAIMANIEKIENEIEEIQDEIDKKQKEFDESYELYCQRLRAMYVSGSVSNLEVILSSSDMSTVLTRSQMIQSVSEQDSKALDSLMKKMEEIEKQKKELEVKRNESNEDKAKLEENKKTLQASINDISSSKKELDDEAAEANRLIRSLAGKGSEIRELIETNQEELRQVEDDIRGASSTGSGSGELGYPTDSRSISAGFPYYSSGGWHGGIDFPVSTGSNIYAAGNGRVTLVKYLNYSYGYHIVIDHGDGLSTLYAHNSQILVSTGQNVSRGQIIAKSGSTGNSTGPHCHFEVRVNGTQVNPLNYLS